MNRLKRGHNDMNDEEENDRQTKEDSHRAQKRTRAERKRALEDDEYCTDVHPNHVRCCGCRRIIKLHSDKAREYCNTDWRKHRKKCPQITGEVNRRVCVAPPLTTTKKVSAAIRLVECRLGLTLHKADSTDKIDHVLSIWSEVEASVSTHSTAIRE